MEYRSNIQSMVWPSNRPIHIHQKQKFYHHHHRHFKLPTKHQPQRFPQQSLLTWPDVLFEIHNKIVDGTN